MIEQMKSPEKRHDFPKTKTPCSKLRAVHAKRRSLWKRVAGERDKLTASWSHLKVSPTP